MENVRQQIYRFFIGVGSVTDLRNVRYKFKSRIPKGIVSVNKIFEQGTALERSPHHVIHCQGVHGCARNLIHVPQKQRVNFHPNYGGCEETLK